MNKILYLLIFISNFYFSQNLHIEYVNNNSKFTSFKEDLYITNENIVSIRDSITLENLDKTPKIKESNEAFFFVKDKLHKIAYFKNKKNDTIIIKNYIDENYYFIEDILPKTEWNINYTETKNILGYECNKATTFFRGSKITAYFTKKIKTNTGPYKFGGLNGLILEVFENDNTINSWKAIKLENLKQKSISLPQINKSEKTITLKEFLALNQKKIDEDFEEILKKLPKEVVVNRNKIERTGIEKKYEWEN